MEHRTPVPEQFVEPFVPPTQRQIDYLIGLREGKDLTTLSPEQRAWLADADFSTVRKQRASDVISSLKELPWLPREGNQEGFAEMMNLGVKTGRYAISKTPTAEEIAGMEAHSPGADAVGKLMFYSVKRVEDDAGNPKACWVDVWASDARYPIRALPQRLEILKAIAADPDAGPRFGREIGRCYVCGRTLTDETSRWFGIGPICREQ